MLLGICMQMYASISHQKSMRIYYIGANVRYRGGVNWDSPQDLNQKMIWLSFNSDTTQWSRLADKYEVRKFITEKGLSDLLVPLYGVWTSVEEFRWSDLPEKFVIKLNNGSGDSLIVRDKSKITEQEVRNHLYRCLKVNLGRDSAEPHYSRIKPKIIAEQLLEPKDGNLVDYKVWCFNGIPYCFFTASNRNIEEHTAAFNLYDFDWNKHNEWLNEEFRNDVDVKKPTHFKEMLEYASRLSMGFPEVRVDFYEVNDKVYFGEMTFTTFGARNRCYTPETLRRMGNMFSVK